MKRPWHYFLPAFGLWLLGSTTIIAAARGDLWLDEIWSLEFSRAATSASDIVVRFKHDNNHVVNTLFMYLAGEQEILFVYRLMAVLSGIGSLLLVGYAAERDWGRLEALCSMFLVATSYPLLLYFSEARGYAPAMFFGLAAYVTLGQDAGTGPWWKAIVFWFTSMAGMLSHATFIMLTAAFATWTLAAALRTAEPRSRTIGRCLYLHGPPFAFFVFWYVFFLRELTIGGGPEYSRWEVLGQATTLLLGLPNSAAFHGLGIVVFLLIVAVGAVSLHRRKDARWAFFAMVLVIAPVLLQAMTSAEYLYFRYFIVCAPFFMLLSAYLVGLCYRSVSGPRRWLGFAAIAIACTGNFPRDYLLITLGRGQYAAALQHISEASGKLPVRVGSDHDFRNEMLFNFYAPRMPEQNLKYVGQGEWLKKPPDWILLHSQDLAYRAPGVIRVPDVGEYRLEQEFGFSGVSGWSWFLFKRED
jgi:hypothetical protein